MQVKQNQVQLSTPIHGAWTKENFLRTNCDWRRPIEDALSLESPEKKLLKL